MRKVLRLAICAAALALGTSVAFADVVTVAFTGQVSRVNDSSLPIPVGATVTGTYSYDTLVPLNSDGTYHEAAPPASISVTVAGGQTYQSQSSWLYQITVTPGSSGGFESGMSYFSFDPSSGNSISIGFYDSPTLWPTSIALPTTVPPVSTPGLAGDGSVNPGGGGFQIQLSSWTQMPSLTISPASSTFVAQQNFDALVLLSSQIGITSMQASVAGTPIALSYPGTCQLAAPNNAGQTALICPNASAVLAGLGGGTTQVDWQVVLADGSTAQQSVLWNLVL